MNERAGAGILCALAAAAVYGLIPNFSRAAFENGVPSYETTFLRTGVIAVVLAVAAIWRGQSIRLPETAILPFLAQAAATVTISICYLAASQFIPVGLAAIVFFTFPVIILLIAPFAERNSPGLPQIGIALVAFTGLGLAMGSGFDAIDIRGVLLAGAAALACVVQFLSGRHIARQVSPIVFGSMVHFAILPITLAVAIWMNGGTMKMFSGAGIIGTGYGFLLAVGFLYVFAYVFHMTSLSMAKASTVAPFFNLEPIVTTFVAALLLGERLTSVQYLGGGLVLAALLASSLIDYRSRSMVTA